MVRLEARSAGGGFGALTTMTVTLRSWGYMIYVWVLGV